jgi:hypothetical protein
MEKTNNIQKLELAKKLFKDNKITIDEFLLLIESDKEYVYQSYPIIDTPIIPPIHYPSPYYGDIICGGNLVGTYTILGPTTSNWTVVNMDTNPETNPNISYTLIHN